METVQFMYSKSFRNSARDGKLDEHVAKHDHIVISGGGHADLVETCSEKFRAKIEPKLYRYLDWWGSSYYKRSESGFPRWVDGPGDDKFGPCPEYKTERSPYLYRIDQHHPLRIVYAIWDIIHEFPHQAGLFLDDFEGHYSKAYWRVPAYMREKCWPLYAPGDWSRPLLDETEGFSRALMGLRSQALIVNGSGRSHNGPRLWESVGKWISIAEVMNGARKGDFLLVKGIDTDRKGWITTTRPEGGYPPNTSFKQVFHDAYKVAAAKGLILGLCLENNPIEGGSSCCTHAHSDPDKWANI
jgi:hypothetical protein